MIETSLNVFQMLREKNTQFHRVQKKASCKTFSEGVIFELIFIKPSSY